jgi:hypothetical protein
MYALFAFVLLLASSAEPASSPSPATTSLPVIITVRSRAECITRLQATGHAIPGLLMNDRIVQRSQAVLAKMAQDTAQHASPEARALDDTYMERLTTAMMHNLKVIKSLIAQIEATSKQNAPDPLVARLQAAAGVQNDELNAFNGITETSRLGEMQDHQPYADMMGAVGPRGPRGVPSQAVGEPLFDAGLPNAGTLPNAIATISPIFAATSIYAPVVQRLTADAQATDQRENDLAETVHAEVASCISHP